VKDWVGNTLSPARSVHSLRIARRAFGRDCSDGAFRSVPQSLTPAANTGGWIAMARSRSGVGHGSPDRGRIAQMRGDAVCRLGSTLSESHLISAALKRWDNGVQEGVQGRLAL
jgi:hypothetical protein